MVNYTLDAPAKGYAALDPNHTHHFLVDDGFFSSFISFSMFPQTLPYAVAWTYGCINEIGKHKIME